MPVTAEVFRPIIDSILCRNNQLPLMAIFLDLKKALYSVDGKELFEILRAYEVHENLI